MALPLLLGTPTLWGYLYEGTLPFQNSNGVLSDILWGILLRISFAERRAPPPPPPPQMLSYTRFLQHCIHYLFQSSVLALRNSVRFWWIRSDCLMDDAILLTKRIKTPIILASLPLSLLTILIVFFNCFSTSSLYSLNFSKTSSLLRICCSTLCSHQWKSQKYFLPPLVFTYFKSHNYVCIKLRGSVVLSTWGDGDFVSFA